MNRDKIETGMLYTSMTLMVGSLLFLSAIHIDKIIECASNFYHALSHVIVELISQGMPWLFNIITTSTLEDYLWFGLWSGVILFLLFIVSIDSRRRV